MAKSKIAIIGLGLIGGSLGLALRQRHSELDVWGVDLCPQIITEAQTKGVIDRGTTQMAEALAGAELVFLAVPVSQMDGLVNEMIPYLARGVIVTDMASTKEKIVETMEKILPEGVRFVGGHPMAGSEMFGLAGANGLLFENAAYILTPSAQTEFKALDRVRVLIEGLGAKVLFLAPRDHDQKVAAVSHLPHVLASALVYSVGQLEEQAPGYFTLAAGGFRDITRIASSQGALWCDILSENKEALLPMLKVFRETLDRFEEAIHSETHEALLELLTQARQWREEMPTGMKAIVPQLYELYVTVPDQPGVLGHISHILGRQKINISDIEIMRIRQEEVGGSIRLGFMTEGGRDQAYAALTAAGLCTVLSTQ